MIIVVVVAWLAAALAGALLFGRMLDVSEARSTRPSAPEGDGVAMAQRMRRPELVH